MKILLFLVAVYALIINQYYYQKKSTFTPLPAPAPSQQTIMIAKDTTKPEPKTRDMMQFTRYAVIR